MFKVQPMGPQHFDFAVELANTMNWNMAPEDFKFMLKLEPQGCFVLLDNLNPIGIATSISFGRIGWFGNLIVKEAYRGLGAGSLLVKHAVEYLHGRGVQTVGLYAYPHLTRFYSSLGFRYDEDFVVMQASPLAYVASETLRSVGQKEFERIVEFDGKYFGGKRRKLLDSIIFEEDNLAYYVSVANGIVGYVAATVYEKMAWIGPLVCKEDSQKTAQGLIRAVLAKLERKDVYLALPKKETTLANALSAIGFEEAFSVSRMFLGDVTERNCIYLAESLERG